MKKLSSHNLDNGYDEFVRKSYSAMFIEKPLVDKYLKSLVGSSTHALDIGCGTGHSIKYLLDLGVKEKNVLGVDMNPDMLRVARKNLPKVQFITTDLSNLKLKKSNYDLLLSVMVFHYLSEKKLRKVIENISEFLKKGGHLFFITLHPLRYIHDYPDYYSDKPKRESTGWGTKIKYYHKTVSKYLNVVIDSGLEIVAVEEPLPIGKNARKDEEK